MRPHSGKFPSPFRALLTGLPLCIALHTHAFDKPLQTAKPLAKVTNVVINLSALSLASMTKRLPVESGNRVQHWIGFVQRHRFKPVHAKLQLVNDYFNAMTYARDEDLWGQADYWATPLEVIALGQGDCEDLAIAKYFTLRAMGVEMEQLGITYVKSYRLENAHMVLEFYDEDLEAPVTLDNMENTIRVRKDLRAIYGFNEENVWAGRDRTRVVGPSTKIVRWGNMQRKLIGQLSI